MRGLLIGVAAAVGVWILMLVVLMLLSRRTVARELAGLLPNLLRLFKGLLSDPRIPRRSKLLLGFAALWVMSPIDLIPEFLPVIGPLDDAVMAALVLRYIVRRAGPEVVTEHWRGAPGTLEVIMGAARQRGPSNPRCQPSKYIHSIQVRGENGVEDLLNHRIERNESDPLIVTNPVKVEGRQLQALREGHLRIAQQRE
jgi:uncharacterized membrane protein YkvA (DUF1232 family)